MATISEKYEVPYADPVATRPDIAEPAAAS